MKRSLLLLMCIPTLAFGNFEMIAGYKKKTRDEMELDKILLKSLQLEDLLNQVVIGQGDAVRITSDAIIRYAAGVNDPMSPIATLLYCGPSGVGKTELAKQLCNILYNDESRFIRLNMAEYAMDHSIQRLIGSPPGYVNHEQGGALTNALRSNPYSIVLLDEAEKAHPCVMKLFLQLFDEGFITSSKGERVDCRKSIFILTSNIAAIEIAQLGEQGLDSAQILEEIQPALMHYLSVELYNRMDPVVFRSLGWEVKESIVHKMLYDLALRIAKAKRITLQFDDSVVQYLVESGFDPLLGARPVKRMIEKELTPLIAKALLRGQFKAGDKLLLTLQQTDLVMKKV